MKDIKTKSTAKDIKVFDRAADVSTHMKNTFVKSKHRRADAGIGA